MRKVAAAAAVVALAAGCSGQSTEPRAWEREAREGSSVGLRGVKLAAALEPFDSCRALLDEVRTQARAQVGAFGFQGGGIHMMGTRALGAAEDASVATAAAPTGGAAGAAVPQAGTDFSTTNVQEAGVDEPDIVKTDGRIVVALAGQRLHVIRAEDPKLLGSVALPEGYPSGLFLLDDRALVLSSGAGHGDVSASATPGRSGIHPPPIGTTVSVVDVSNPERPNVTGSSTVDGDLVAGRLVEGVPRLVLRSQPRIGFAYPHEQPVHTEAEARRQQEVAEARNKAAVERAGIEAWLPAVRSGEGAGRPLVDCEDVAAPPEPSGVGMLTVVSVDPDSGVFGEAVSVMASGETVYASGERLYVATTKWQDGRGRAEPGDLTTEIHRFDLADAEKARYEGSGQVPGHLLNQFSMSEHEGRLRLATTSNPNGGRGSESAVRVLEARDGALVEIGSVGGLGKDERIYAVRFLGTTGYVVTFRQTDPLYVVDLKDPTKPAVRGELKINGYSAYLHPIGDGLVLGLGQDATAEGRRLGTQLSLFDVSDPAKPTRLHQASLGQAESEAEHDHHAFLHWPKTGLTVVPVMTYGPSGPGFVGAVGFDVDRAAGIKEAGRVQHPTGDAHNPAMIRRSLVVGDAVLTLSERGLLASDLATLDQRGWVAF